jgi:hypothetical protein
MLSLDWSVVTAAIHLGGKRAGQMCHPWHRMTAVQDCVVVCGGTEESLAWHKGKSVVAYKCASMCPRRGCTCHRMDGWMNAERLPAHMCMEREWMCGREYHLENGTCMWRSSMLQLADSRVLHSGQMPLTCASCIRSEVPEEAPSLAGLVMERVEPLRPRRAFMAPDTEKASEAVSPRTRIRQTPKDTFEVICDRAGNACVSVDGEAVTRSRSHGKCGCPGK